MKRTWLWLVVLCLMVSTSMSAEVLKIVVDNMIHPISREFIGRAIASAESHGDKALLIELSTPGGLEKSMRGIIHDILASKVPVIIWVAPSGSRAASAGFFILESADVAAMAPGTNTGAAHPVVLGGPKLGEVEKKKMENDAAAFIRSIASQRGRNVAEAESAVRQSKSFTDREALAEHLIDIIAANQNELFKKIDGMSIKRFGGQKAELHLEGQPVRTMAMTVREEILSFIMDPNIAFILLALGALGIWAEFNHPGAILPGVVGLVSILLAVFALNILPTRYASLALIVAAFVLFALEAKFTSHGVLGAAGVICMFIGGLLLVDGPIPEMRVHWFTALAVSGPFGVIAVFLMSLVLKARGKRVTTGDQGMVGEVGEARSALDPAGTVFVHGEIWTARSSRPIAKGAQITVLRVNADMTLEVEPVGETNPGEPAPASS